ncbi:hypothetical protein [Hyphomicrobium sp. CS1GBMeth3]|uniref:hypothetical protein n=1 Tax=Hyphomicrobium sp. CS1GBMeth3 TaxID=1892845 RepID=UPI001114FADB|nr:hypothetical protein [Hyphomicrobium sp. CS1GBMeth3]
MNTDRHLWPDVSEHADADSIHVTKDGGIGINVGGHVIVMPLRMWFSAALACQTHDVADEIDRLRSLQAVPEDMLVAAYRRGCEWCIENGVINKDDPTFEYVAKAGRDYADKALSASPAPPVASGWQCSECGCRSYAIVDERQPNGVFAPGHDKRCVECKLVHPAPPGAAAPQTQHSAEQVCHDEQLSVWAEELLCELECWIAAPETCDDGVQCAQAVKAEIKRIVTTAFELAAPQTTVSSGEPPTGAIENGRVLLQRVVAHYDFECEAGKLVNCWEFDEAVRCFEAMAEWISSRDALTSTSSAERDQIHFLQAVIRNALQWHEDHRGELQQVGPGTIPQWVTDGWAVFAALRSLKAGGGNG